MELFLLVQQLPLSLDHHPVCPRVLLHEQLSVLRHQPSFRRTVAANQATDHPITGFALDTSTSATLPGI